MVGLTFLAKLAIAVDVGATNVRVGIGDENGVFLYKKKDKTTRRGDEKAVANQVINLLSEASPNLFKDVVAVGVGCAGRLLTRDGIVYSPNLPFEKIDLKKPLEEHFRKPVYLVNDCVAAVWGEKVFGVAREYNNVVYLTISSGIGGGAIVDGKLLLGKCGGAHEVGHIVVDIEERMRCGCGGYGHWEAYCSGANMANYVKYLMENAFKREDVEKSMLYAYYVRNELSPEVVYEAARRKDFIALQVVEKLAKINAMGVASIVNVYDPEIIIIGGGIALNNKELVIEPMKKYLDLYLFNKKPLIVETSFGEDVGLKGALAIALKPPQTLVQA
ncbi:MAG: ROK family protein [Candidatus Methanomethylicota archaeon]|uniref:ROK family protein n=1 Tax=Thermoproteota archaeon TaxID=2056631 RepID=A0A497ELL6_9CREN|nr:MAG: ROK family protein [Candidatus Verstraetearchaeota archaeon]